MDLGFGDLVAATIIFRLKFYHFCGSSIVVI